MSMQQLYHFQRIDNVGADCEERRRFPEADIELELVRSDQGDGGWSIHVAGDESGEDLVISGPSGIQRLGGPRLRPSARDWQVAVVLAKAGMRGVDLA